MKDAGALEPAEIMIPDGAPPVAADIIPPINRRIAKLSNNFNYDFTNPQGFTALITMISDITSKHFTDHEDTEYIAFMWYIVKVLCGYYSIVPNMAYLRSLLGIANRTLFQWRNRNDERAQLLKAIYDEIEDGLQIQTANKNSIGSIFLLKSVYGYDDNSGTKIVIDTNSHSMQDLKKRYGTEYKQVTSDSSENLKVPEGTGNLPDDD